MLIRILTCLLAAATFLSAQLNREWTDDLGRKTKASLVKVENNNAVLLLPNGRQATFPIAKLSQEDQDFIKETLAAHIEGKADEEDKESTTEAASENLNWTDPWPTLSSYSDDPEIETISEDAEKKEFIYESANYRYTCDVRLSKSVVKGFAVMFEATHQLVRELPLAMDGGAKKDGKYQIFLYEKMDSYHYAGGPQGSAGVFISGKNVVLVPLDSLGVRPVGSGYMLDRSKSSSTLPHELTHQLTPPMYFAPGSIGWFIEGIAEYVATTPYRSGAYNVRSNLKPIIEYVTDYGKKNTGGRALGKKIELGSLKRFLLQDYPTFQQNPQLNYGCALLITYYYFHMDRDGDGACVKKFLQALREGKTGQDAIDVLLDGRSYEEMEAEISKAFSRRGVKLTF